MLHQRLPLPLPWPSSLAWRNDAGLRALRGPLGIRPGRRSGRGAFRACVRRCAGLSRVLRAAVCAMVLSGGLAAAQAALAIVAVDASFARPLGVVAEGFETETGHRLRLVSADGGRLLARIRQGAPYDILLAADRAVVDRLQAEGHVEAARRFVFATGRLVLWSPDARFIDEGGAILKNRLVDHVVLASPGQSAYGAAAHEALRRLNLQPHLFGKLVQADSLEQAFGWVGAGSADLAFLALAQVFELHRLVKGSAWLLPSDLYEPLVHDAAVLAHGRGNAAVDAFLLYLRRGDVQTYLRSCGLES